MNSRDPFPRWLREAFIVCVGVVLVLLGLAVVFASVASALVAQEPWRLLPLLVTPAPITYGLGLIRKPWGEPTPDEPANSS